MSAQEELAICSSGCLRWTLHNTTTPNYVIKSFEFRFDGGGWRFHYEHIPPPGSLYCLRLWRCSGVSPSGPLRPFYVSVRVESSERGRIVEGLSREKRFTYEFQYKNTYPIWQKKEKEILEDLPEFHRSGVLTFLVEMKTEGDSSACQLCLPLPTADHSSRSVSCLESLLDDFTRYMAQGSDPDVEFVCRGESTKAHGAVVCARSPVIASMLASDMLEGRTRVIQISHIEPEVFRYFLRYIYSGALPELTQNLALNLYEAGDQYAVFALAKRCSQYLLENLSINNVCDVLVVAEAHSDSGFVEKIIGYMRVHAGTIGH